MNPKQKNEITGNEIIKMTDESMKHTKGKWSVGKLNSTVVSTNNDGLNIRGAYEEDALDHYGGYLIAESVSSANAKLIAVAPELLEFAEDIVRRFPVSSWVNQQARQLIKKATA